MPLHSIEYLNARRNAKAASGGRRYVVKRNAVHDRSRLRALDIFERMQDEIAETLSEINRRVAALRAHAASFETLCPGESFDDLACF